MPAPDTCERCEEMFEDNGGVVGFIVRGMDSYYSVCQHCLRAVVENIDDSVKLYREGQVLVPAHSLSATMQGHSSVTVGHQGVSTLENKGDDDEARSLQS